MTTMLLLAWFGCASEPVELTPAKVAELSNAIAADPASADATLSAAGTDRATFEAKLYEIASDPAATDAFLSARK